jgi:hypothetical protein
VRHSPLGMSATNWPIVPPLDDRWWWMWSTQWNENWQGKPKKSEKIFRSATSSTTNPTWCDLGSNSGCCGEKPGNNHLSNGTVFSGTPRNLLHSVSGQVSGQRRSLQLKTEDVVICWLVRALHTSRGCHWLMSNGAMGCQLAREN